MNDLPFKGERLLRLKEVEQKAGIGSTTIYRKMAEGTFPQPLTLGKGTVRWKESRIDEWIASLAEKPKAQPKKSA